jgi:hypothetical protein
MIASRPVALPDTLNLQQLWKCKTSAQEGFARTYYTETIQGDHLEVDFNYGRRMARVSLRVAAENGREYVALFKSGTILQEREVAGKRSLDLTSRMAPLSAYFQCLGDESLLESIGGHYGLPTSPALPSRGAGPRREYLPITTRFSVTRWIRDYFRRKRDQAARLRYRPWYERAFQRAPSELTDLSLGLCLYYGYMQSALNLTELAGYLGALGLFSGALDWVWRQRDPFLPKVAGLLASSAAAVYVQVQHRMWGIFL